MGLLQLLSKSIFGYKGQKPVFNGETPSSKLHDTTSINNNPKGPRKPSQLDLEGKRPTAYLDNPPK